MGNSKEYEFYLAALDNNNSLFGRRRAIRRLSKCGTEEALYYMNELVVDRYCLLPDWTRRIAREYYVCLCLEFL
ncbi:hypothetical protein MSMTP_1228 [Methanosarcina sp. MTP4]|uniref:hypothetical protein n=1 Tax=Methanosarcina sp. MTP4 TaxID=1434100 RepID=UPI000615C647|nr:hypothetical protein [Methanosarcina sp. MTP4]AKB24697.1 hypothetical protein MSMTP_1228 [Methanosarcina sp. MTP4]